ncbi:hypothetical protein [Rhizohabitans arisaemae]|uniref:hypothetical protein n=1 Tax=Rhizohabitans arisaemae TaxID=2720610 RepID=UPI0024B0CEBC|nr:hypothetical protein [Rhizohabitans arisaemae]
MPWLVRGSSSNVSSPSRPGSDFSSSRNPSSPLADSHSDRAESADNPFSTCRQNSRSNRARPAPTIRSTRPGGSIFNVRQHASSAARNPSSVNTHVRERRTVLGGGPDLLGEWFTQGQPLVGGLAGESCTAVERRRSHRRARPNRHPGHRSSRPELGRSAH